MKRMLLKKTTRPKNLINFKSTRKFSSLPKNALFEHIYNNQKKNHEQPVFKIPATSFRSLSHPKAFYNALLNGIQGSHHRICFSSLYWGVGELEELLVTKLHTALNRKQHLRLRILMDMNRGQRKASKIIKFDSSAQLVEGLASSYPNNDVQIGYFCPNPNNFFTEKKMYQLGEILGVQHSKLVIFDNSVLLTGANLEEQYFTNRKDRYWIFNNVPELANYLEDYILTYIANGEQVDWEGEPRPAHKKDDFKNYGKISDLQMKMLRFSQYKLSEKEVIEPEWVMELRDGKEALKPLESNFYKKKEENDEIEPQEFLSNKIDPKDVQMMENQNLNDIFDEPEAELPNEKGKQKSKI